MVPNMFSLFLSSPVKKVMLIFPLQVNWKKSFNFWCSLNLSKAAVCYSENILKALLEGHIVCINRPTAE